MTTAHLSPTGRYHLGLDLGTTFTAAAVWRGGRCEISPLGNRAAAIASMVHLDAAGEAVVGDAARRRLVTDPSRVAREFKRRFGDPTPLLLGGAPVAPEALTARLARAVVATVAEREGGPPASVTVTHPATWGPFKRDLLHQAVRMADLRDVTLLTEPEAAAWEYSASRPLGPGATVAVYDLGGGTFDATVLRASDRGFELLGEPEGIERLGGIDIDQAVLGFVTEALDGAVDALDPDDPVALADLARLRADCVEAKEALSSEHEAAVPVALPALHTEVRITRSEFEGLIRPVLGDTLAAMRRALASAGVEPADLDAVLLVGGSSRIPLIGEMVGQLLGRPIAVDAHPKHLVALGAARHAAAQAGAAPGPVTGAVPLAAPAAAGPSEPAPAASAAASRVEAPAPAPIPTPDSVPAPGLQPAPTATEPARSRPSRAVKGLAVGAVAAIALVVALLVVAGGDSSREDLDAAAQAGAEAGSAATAAAPAPDCSATGPFVCITSARHSPAGGIEAEFVPVGFGPEEPSRGGTHLVFFLADVVDTTHGPAAVARGLPIEWGASQPFSGWSAEEVARRAAVCALVVTDGQPLTGSGNCRAV